MQLIPRALGLLDDVLAFDPAAQEMTIKFLRHELLRLMPAIRCAPSVPLHSMLLLTDMDGTAQRSRRRQNVGAGRGARL